MNDPEINRFMETRFRQQKQSDIEAYVRRMRDDPYIHFFAIVDRSQDRHIGNIKLAVNPVHERGEISLFLGDKSKWGKGFGTEAIDLIKDYAFEVLNLRKLTAGCYAVNKGSARAFLKAGFHQEATMKNHYMCDGRVVDGFEFALFHPRLA